MNYLEIAKDKIADFEFSKVPGVWPNLDKRQIIYELRSRLENPFLVNQGSQPLCGPATVIFELIRKQPVKYVEICRSLYQIGGFHTQSGKWIFPSNNLRESGGDLKMPQVDWMLSATLRESENLLFPVAPDSPQLIRNISGMTKSWEISGWLKEILGYRKIGYNNAYLFGDFPALRVAAEVVDAGGVALALVTAKGLLIDELPLLPYPTHWIVILGGIKIEETTRERHRIKFDCYSWGRKLRVDVDAWRFKSYFWELVTGNDFLAKS
jgi:hypothetical protein